MERKPLSFSITITVASGAGNNTTPSNSAMSNAGGYLRQLIIDAPQDTATYDFRIENSSGRTVVRRTQQVGDLAEDMATPLPAGTYTCYLSNCSHNGAYTIELIYAEVY